MIVSRVHTFLSSKNIETQCIEKRNNNEKSRKSIQPGFYTKQNTSLESCQYVHVPCLLLLGLVCVVVVIDISVVLVVVLGV